MDTARNTIYHVIIPAGGSGSRMNLPIAKQYLMIGRYPLIYYTIRKFYHLEAVNRIIIAVSPSSISLMENWAVEWRMSDKIRIVPGGATRQDSVWSALQTIPDPSAFVMIHDAVRPYVSRELIEESMAAVRDHHAVIPVIPVNDTIKLIRDHQEKMTPPRDRLVAVQTPQVFRLDLIRQAIQMVIQNSITVTDDAMAVELAGYPVFTIPGEESNRKITTPEDLNHIREDRLV